jgi:hypothetical protein
MTAENRKLPIGIQDFESLRKGGYLYVDKTAYIYRLAQEGKPYFLGRPRRFGKSLLLSTMKAYFLGKKELFEGLAIAESDKGEWPVHPVLHLDLNGKDYQTADDLRSILAMHLDRWEEEYGCNTQLKDEELRFAAVIERAYRKTGQKVVVLIDEYDKPLLATMEESKASVNEDMRSLLKGFYGCLKTADPYLRLAFLTGVTKFSKISVFSDLNQLIDISLDNNYSSICGITETELRENFKPELLSLAEATGQSRDETLAEVKKRYDGYHFSAEGDDVYNPFSLLNTLAKKRFADYWYQTGTPTFLVKMVKQGRLEARMLESDIDIDAGSIDDYRTDNPDPIPILYQSGYLTIKHYDSRFDSYTLGYPNEEVKYGFMRNLMPAYLPAFESNRSDFSIVAFSKDLFNGRTENFMQRLQSFFSNIPYELNNKTERDFQTVFYLLFSLIGAFIKVEESSAAGRSDAVVVLSDTVYVFEFKLTGNGTAEDALKQIDEKGYATPYLSSGKKIIKIGAEFSAETRTLSRWLIV